MKEVWFTEINQEYCESLISSMPRRIRVVIDSKGRIYQILKSSHTDIFRYHQVSNILVK